MNDRSRGTPQDSPPDAMDRWLRETMAHERGGVSSECLDPETLAAWAEGILSGSERSFAEAHAARCARCQAMLAVMARTVPPDASVPRSSLRKWLMMLTPAAAAAAAVALWFAVEPRQRHDVQPLQAPSATIARDDRVAAPASRAPAAPAPEAASEQASASKSAFADKDTSRREVVTPRTDRKTERPSGRGPDESQRRRALGDEFKALEKRKEIDALAPSTAARAAADPPPPAAPPPGAVAETVTVVQQTPQIRTGQQQNVRAEEERLRLQAAQQNAAQPSPQQSTQQAAASATPPAPVPPLPPAAPAAKAAAPATGDRAAADTAAKPGRAAGSVDESRRGAAGGAGRGGTLPTANELQVRRFAAPPVVTAPDGTTRWRVSQRFVEQSLDGGATWSTQFKLDDQTFLAAGAAPSSSVCWFVGASGAIVATSDGRTWRRVAFPLATDLVAVVPIDALNVSVVTSDTRVFVTNDAGVTWTVRKN